MRGRYQVHAGRDAVGAVLFDHAAEDGRHGQGAEAFARLILLVVRPRFVERGRRRPAEPLVRGGGRGHRGRLVADRGRHVRQHDDAVRGHSPPSVGRRYGCRRRRMAKSLRQTEMENYRNGTTINIITIIIIIIISSIYVSISAEIHKIFMSWTTLKGVT